MLAGVQPKKPTAQRLCSEKSAVMQPAKMLCNYVASLNAL